MNKKSAICLSDDKFISLCMFIIGFSCKRSKMDFTQSVAKNIKYKVKCVLGLTEMNLRKILPFNIEIGE